MPSEPPTSPGTDPRYLVPVVRSTFRALEEISRAGRLSLKQVIDRTGIPKATAYRILSSLCHLGYLVRDGRKRYCISPQLANLATEDALSEGLKQLSQPLMRRLRDKHGETVNLGRLHQGQIRYVEVVPSEHALRLHETPGASVSLHASALGRVILAFSPAELAENMLRDHQLEAFTPNTVTAPEELIGSFGRIREHGYALDCGEVSTFATCVAAPIVGADGYAVAALSISGPSSRFSPGEGTAVIEDLLGAVTDISQRLREPAG